MSAPTYLNPPALHSSPAFSQVVRVPAGHDTIYVGGQNGVDAEGRLVGPDLANQTRRAMENLRTCLEAAGAGLADVVHWRIFAVEGVSVQEGYAAAMELIPQDVPPPAITVAFVSALGVPGTLVEIEAVAAVPPTG
ncbi:RidA family protein [Pseudonocardia sp.]|uniref:RidA family protein n=1 Tax=Pseudonocardia sp. TaxID=60912 RepID=UPI003D13A674